jgi:hypothetical protein
MPLAISPARRRLAAACSIISAACAAHIRWHRGRFLSAWPPRRPEIRHRKNGKGFSLIGSNSYPQISQISQIDNSSSEVINL